MTQDYRMNRRRYDLDWLRVLAFGVLILYHSGMFYVADWGWHIKSDVTSETLQYFMRLVNPWRMSLLFLVSGAALWFASKKVSGMGLFTLRLKRLLPPLVLGMLVIVPPQIYYQIMQHENVVFGSYLDFYRIYLDLDTTLYPDHQSPVGIISWTHLWFIPYLLVYTLVFAISKPLLDRLAARLKLIQPGLFWLYVIPFSLYFVFNMFLEPLFPRTYTVVGDWYCHAIYFSVFVLGYLAAGHLQIANTLVRSRWLCLAVSTFTYVLLICCEQGVLSGPRAVYVAVDSINAWGWILTVLAWSAAFLNRPGKALTYMNTAILPWYVLHQTITIILAWHLSSLGLPIGLEAILVVLGTAIGCALGYELIRRFQVMRFIFGMKNERKTLTKRAQNVDAVLEKC